MTMLSNTGNSFLQLVGFAESESRPALPKRLPSQIRCPKMDAWLRRQTDLVGPLPENRANVRRQWSVPCNAKYVAQSTPVVAQNRRFWVAVVAFGHFRQDQSHKMRPGSRTD
jgi:hypothetical protein